MLLQILGLQLIKVLQAQNEMLAPAALGIGVFLLNIGMNLFFIRRLGFLGAPIATTVSRILYLVGSILVLAHSLYCQGRHSRACIRLGTPPSRLAAESTDSGQEGFSSGLTNQTADPIDPSVLQAAAATVDTCMPCHDGEAEDACTPPHAAKGAVCLAAVSWEQAWQQSIQWKSLQSYLKLAVPGGLMVAMEAGSFDITTMMAGMLGTVQVPPPPAVLLSVSCRRMELQTFHCTESKSLPCTLSYVSSATAKRSTQVHIYVCNSHFWWCYFMWSFWDAIWGGKTCAQRQQ